jgi:predicted RNase H-like nuclease (RuvC/YqgF family)
MNWNSIIADIIALLAICGWFTNGRKQRKETESIEADNKKKNMELGKQYVDEFKENIVKPLQNELKGLKREVNKLQKAVDKVNDCDFRDDCPVRAELQKREVADNTPEK